MAPIEITGTSPARTDTGGRARDFALVATVGLLFFALNVDFKLSGDATMYADYVLLGKFDELTLHIGYYAIVYAVHHTIGAVLGAPIEESMAWINVGAGALTLGVAYLLGRSFLGNRRDALLCALILAVCGRMLLNATSSEVYMTQTLFVLWSFYLFVRERIVAAGLVAALGLLVSPLSAFAYLFYPVLDYQRAGRIRWAVLCRLAGAALLLYLPYLIVYGHELLWGYRGLLGIRDFRVFNPRGMLAEFPKFQFKHYSFLLLLLVPAIFAARRHGKFLVLSLAVALPHLYIISKLVGEDNVFILNTDFFFACWLVIGWRQLEQWAAAGRWLAPIPLVAHLGLLWLSGALFHFEAHKGLPDELRATSHKYLVDHDSVVVTDWNTLQALVFYGRPAPRSTIRLDPLAARVFDTDNIRRMNPGLLDARELYLIDPWEPGPLSLLLRSKASLDAQWRDNAIVSRADRYLRLDCKQIERTSSRIYRCQKRPGAIVSPES